MKVKWEEEIEKIKKLISEGFSYEKIGRDYKVSGASVKKALLKLGVKLQERRKINPNEHFNKGRKTIHYCLNCGKELSISQMKYCSLECQIEFKKNNKINEWKENPSKFNNEWGYPFIKNYLLKKYNNKCEICGWGEVNKHTNIIPLEVHHINGDCTDNREENLQLLCPNCHSLTENFGSRNKFSKRYKLKNYKKNNK